MPRPNTSFEISVEEMEIIENALRAAIPANDNPGAPKGATAPTKRAQIDI